jgi:hypothetical protein
MMLGPPFFCGRPDFALPGFVMHDLVIVAAPFQIAVCRPKPWLDRPGPDRQIPR